MCSFHCLAILNSVVMRILEWVFGKHMCASLLGIQLGVELLAYRVYVYLDLLDTAKQYSQVIVPIYSPTNNLVSYLYIF